MMADSGGTARTQTIELKDLRWALVVSRHRSLRRAADTLNVQQSTLSRRLGDLEYRLGAKLFERTTGGTRPTDAGLEFLETAQRILEQTDTAFHRFHLRSRGESGRLTIGVYASPTTGNMHATLSEHHRRFPDVDVLTVDGTREKLLCALTANMVDIAVMSACWVNWGERMLPLWSERVIVGLPQEHLLEDRQVGSWKDICGEPILLTRSGPGPELERLLMTRVHESQLRHTLHHESGLDRLLGLVSTGYGAVLMLEGGTGLHCDGVVYREVHDDEGRAERLSFAAYWRETNSNPTLPPFLDMLRERYPEFSSGSEQSG